MKKIKNSHNIFVILLTSIMAPLVLELFTSALPYIADSYNLSGEHSGYIITYALIGIVIGQFFAGLLSEVISSYWAILLGLLLLLISSFFSAYSINYNMLLIMRLVQGMAASIIGVNNRALAREVFSSGDYFYIISNVMLVWRCFFLIAPVLGSFIQISLGWKYIYYFVSLYCLFVLFMYSKNKVYFHTNHVISKNKKYYFFKKITSSFWKYGLLIKKKEFLICVSGLGATTSSGVIFAQFAPYYILHKIHYSSAFYIGFAGFSIGIGYLIANILTVRLKKREKLSYLIPLVFISSILGYILLLSFPFSYAFFIVGTFLIQFSVGVNGPLILVKTLKKYKKNAVIAASTQGLLLWGFCSIVSIIFQKLSIKTISGYVVFSSILLIWSIYIGLYHAISNKRH